MPNILLPSNAINWGQPVNRASPLNRGLVSWWLANGPSAGSNTWQDLLRLRDGTLTNMEPGSDWTAANRPGGRYALNFDGVNEYISLPATFSSLVDPYHISMWVKPTTLSQDGIWISLASAGSAAIAVGMYNTNNKIFFGTSSTLRGLYGVSTYLTAGAWTHVSILATNTHANMRCYINGLSVTVADVGDYYVVSQNNIGARNNGAAYPFSGAIDDVRLHNRALSSNEVYQIYQDSLTGYKKTLNRLTRTFAYSSGAAAAVYNPFTGGINPLQGFIAA